MIALFVGAILTWLVSPNLFGEFHTVRAKVVRDPVTATDVQVRISVAPRPDLAYLQPPFASISRVRNTGSAPLLIDVAVDDVPLCRHEIAPGASRRIDCAVSSWSGSASHTVTLTGSSPSYTVESVELASHYGALTPGPRDVIVGPRGMTSYSGAPVWHLGLIAILAALTIVSVQQPMPSRVLRIAHLTTVWIVGFVMLIAIASEFVSPYAVLLQDRFVEDLLLMTALPVLVRLALRLSEILRRPAVSPVLPVAGAGVVAGIVFLSYATYRIAERHNNQVSGLVLISHRFFDASPQAAQPEIRNTLQLDPGGGYDGQFFYLMAFDPFLTVFRTQPSRYREFIDNPPYRYGRIGFSLLTKAVALNRPTTFPVVMVGLVISALIACALLLGRLAHHYGLSGWYGALTVLVPGFWQSVEGTLPEPVAVALFLGGLLCFLREKWWACGALFGAAMLTRETGGALVLAVAAPLALRRQYRELLIVALLAFLPIVLWKAFVGSVFWSEYGTEALLHMPANTGAPFGGVRAMLAAVGQGNYIDGSWNATRAGVSYAILSTAGIVLAGIAVIRKPTPLAFAACAYAMLAIFYNYDGVWGHVGNAQRLTIDLFVALSLIFVQQAPKGTAFRYAFAAFWTATAWYLFFGAFDATDARNSLFGWLQ